MSTPTPAATPEVYANRRTRLIEAMGRHNIPALLVTTLTNCHYLTGFRGSNAALLLTADGDVLLGTDGRYTEQVAEQAPGVPVLLERDTIPAVRHRYAGTIAVEGSLDLATAARLGDYTLAPALVEELRLVKDPTEIALLEHAASIADNAWNSLLDDGIIRVGTPEITVATELEYRMRQFGAEGISFDTIVASGLNGAKPHHQADATPLTEGLITIDFGVWYGGYASDQTRLVGLGDIPARQLDIAEAVYASFTAGCEFIGPGKSYLELDIVCRQVLVDAGFGEYFTHSTGHGVGLDVHEGPYAASRTAPESLAEVGHTITVEPGVYIAGVGGARIENTLLIEKDGARPLNTSPAHMVRL